MLKAALRIILSCGTGCGLYYKQSERDVALTALEKTVILHEIVVIDNSSDLTGSALSHYVGYVIGLRNLSSRQTTGTACCPCPHAACLS